MEQLLNILQGIRSDVDFEKEESLIDGNVLDSFDIVSLITEVSDTFDVRIPASEIIPENFNSAEALWTLIEKLMDE